MRPTITRQLILTISFVMVSIISYGQFSVTNGNDGSPAPIGSLRAAIQDANANFIGLSFITVDPGLSINLTEGTLDVTSTIFIFGNGSTVDGSLNSNRAITAVGTSLPETLSIDNLNFTNNTSSTDGGAISASSMALFLLNSTFSNNTAMGSPGSGGAVYIEGIDPLDIDSCIFNANTATRAGGAIETQSIGQVTINGTNFTNNTVTGPPGNGGAFHITGNANSNISNGNVTNNSAANEGGAFWNGTGAMTVNGVSFMSNSALGSNTGGGALFNNGGTLAINAATTLSQNIAMGTTPGGRGGAIFNNTGGILTLAAGLNISGNYASRAGGAIEDASGGSLVLTEITMEGNSAGSDIGLGTMANPGNGGALHLSGTTSVSILNSTIKNNQAAQEGGGLWNNAGTMSITGSTISGNMASGNSADDGGGGIFNNGGTLNVLNATITNNAAAGTAGSGGGIQNVDGGSLTVNNSTIADNTAKRAGGGIEDNSATTPGNITLLNTNLNNNNAGNAPGNGGGLHITGPGTATITDGTVNGNIAKAEGGGLWNGSGSMTVNNVIIDGNTASGNDPDQGGGGIFNEGGVLIIQNGTTISNNIANGTAGSGGGILNNLGTLTVSDSELSGNTSMRAGGAIEENSVVGSMLTLTNVVFTLNTTSAAPGNGGGLHITGAGDSNITGGSATGNIAASEGGALWNGVGIMIIDGMTIDANTAQGADADNGGGGVFNNGGTLNIINGTTIINNLATGASGSGGGLFSTSGDVTITDSSLSGNSANRAGGAIELIDGTLTFTSSDMTNNDVNGTAGIAAPGNGGGLHVSGNSGLITISASTVSGNEAAREGGGLWNQSGTMMNIDTTTIDGNSSFGMATDDGGAGIFNNGGMLEVVTSTISNNNATAGTSSGGAIHNATGGDVIVMRSTISGNSANGSGGGVYNNGASLDLNAVTVAMNTAGLTGGGIEGATSTSLKNTLIALNTASSGMDVNGSFVSNNYNLIGNDDASAFPEQANDIENVDAMLGPLQNNGGVTETHELLFGSLAYNAGDPADLFIDQIDQVIFEGIRDIGAFEAQTIILSIEDITNEGSGILIYPNPSKGFATAKIPGSFGNDVQITIVELGSGKIVRNYRATNGENDLDFSSYSSGVYVIKIVSEISSATHRLILSK